MSEVNVHQDEQVTTKKAPYLRLLDDRGIQSVTSIDVDVLLFLLTSRMRPVSITQTTSGIVTDVSAMFVEHIIFLHPDLDGRNARRWSLDDKVE